MTNSLEPVRSGCITKVLVRCKGLRLRFFVVKILLRYMSHDFFSSLIGHEKVKEFLINSLNKGKISHAYIFCGPENIGKTKTAECFASALLGGMPKKLPYENYESENEFYNLKNNPDFILIEKEESHLKNITINQIRELIVRIQSTSFLGGRKVVVIKDADLMTLEAANAFLKSLEEPKGNVVIILLVSNIKNLPETIISRCQIIYFHPVSPLIIKEHLIKNGVDSKKADLIVFLAGSRPGLAIRFLKDEGLLRFYAEQIDFFGELINLPLHKRLSKIREIISGKEVEKMRETLYTILSVWLKAAQGLMRESLNANPVERIYLAMSQLKANVNPRLVLENLMINL